MQIRKDAPLGTTGREPATKASPYMEIGDLSVARIPLIVYSYMGYLPVERTHVNINFRLFPL